MNIEKIQPVIIPKIKNSGSKQKSVKNVVRKATTSENKIKPRKLPNSVGIDSDYYFSSKPVKRTTVKYSIEDEEKMKLMNDAERKCYEAYLILTGNYTI